MIKPIVLLIALFAAAGVFLFLLSKRSRANSQIEPKQLTEDEVKIPVNHDDYKRFIIVQGGSVENIKKLLIEFGELNISNEHEIKKVNISKLGDLFLIQVNDDLSFYEYHNASHWLIGFGSEDLNGVVNKVFSIALNQKSSKENYYAYIDTDQTYDDTQIGAFENGSQLSIFLPGAYEENGNIILNPDVSPKFKSPTDLLKNLNIDLNDLKNPQGQDFEFKIYY